MFVTLPALAVEDVVKLDTALTKIINFNKAVFSLNDLRRAEIFKICPWEILSNYLHFVGNMQETTYYADNGYQLVTIPITEEEYNNLPLYFKDQIVRIDCEGEESAYQIDFEVFNKVHTIATAAKSVLQHKNKRVKEFSTKTPHFAPGKIMKKL